MEPLTLQVHLATTDSVDADELATIAARTFPMACPPSMASENIALFIDSNLSATRFAEYLTDPQRAVLTAQQDGRIVGYAMLIRGVDDDTDVQRAVELRPAAELSKLYLLPDFNGTGASTALMPTSFPEHSGVLVGTSYSGSIDVVIIEILPFRTKLKSHWRVPY